MKDVTFKPNSFLTKLVSLLVAELFLCSSILPAWALPTDSLRPRPTVQIAPKVLSQELAKAADGGENKEGFPGLWLGRTAPTMDQTVAAIATTSEIRLHFVEHYPAIAQLVRGFLEEHQKSPTIHGLEGLEVRILQSLDRVFVIQPKEGAIATPGIVIKEDVFLGSFIEPSGDILLVKELLDEMESNPDKLDLEQLQKAQLNYLIFSILFGFKDVDTQRLRTIKRDLSFHTLRAFLRRAFLVYQEGFRVDVSTEDRGETPLTPARATHVALLTQAAEADHALIVLKGGKWGGLRPAVKRRILKLLTPYYEITEGTSHRLSYSTIIGRWGDDLWRRLVFRRAIRRELTPVEKEWLRYRLSHQGPSAVKRFLRNLKQARWGMSIGAIEFRKEVDRFEFVLDYLDHQAQPFLLHRKVPREDVIRGLGIAPDELAGSLGRRDLAKLSEQDFVKRVVVEAIRRRLFVEMKQPTHPLHGFLESAQASGLTDESYFFGLLSPIHSPYYAHHNEFNRDLSYLLPEDLRTFAAVAETHRTQGGTDGARARDGGYRGLPGILRSRRTASTITPGDIEQALATSKLLHPFVELYPDLAADLRQFLEEHRTTPIFPELTGLEVRLLADLERLQVVQPEVGQRAVPAIVIKKEEALFSLADPARSPLVVQKVLEELGSYSQERYGPERSERIQMAYLISALLHGYDDMDPDTIRRLQDHLTQGAFRRMLAVLLKVHQFGSPKPSHPAILPPADPRTLHVIGPDMQRELVATHQLSRLLSHSKRHSLILLKGGERGGLNPQLKDSVIQQLRSSFDIVEGTVHPLSLDTIWLRWGVDIIRRILSREGFRPAVPRRVIRLYSRLFKHPLMQRSPAWSKRFALSLLHTNESWERLEEALRQLPDTHPLKEGWLVVSTMPEWFREEQLFDNPKYPLDARRLEFVSDYLFSQAQPLLLYRRLTREEVVATLKIPSDLLASLLRGRSLQEMPEQNFVKDVVVEAIRRAQLQASATPTHPLHQVIAEAHRAGMQTDSYFLGLVSFVHSPKSGPELKTEVALLPRQDLETFIGAIERDTATDGGHRNIPGILRGRGGPEAFTEEEVSRAVASSTMSQRLADYDPEMMGKVRAFLEEHRRTPTIPALAGLEERLMDDLETVLVIQPQVNDKEIPGIIVKKHDALFSVAAPGEHPLVVKKVLVEMGRYAKTVIRDPEKVRALQSAYLITTLLHRYEDIGAQTLKQVRKRLARKSLSHFFTQLVRQHHAPRSVAAARNPYRLGPEGLAYLRAMGPEKHKEIEETSRLSGFLTKNDVYSLVLLKGGARGGLHPEVKKRFLQRLRPSFEIVEGTVHPPSGYAIIARWGTDLLRRIYSREGLRSAFPRRLIRVMDRMITHPFIQRAPAWAKRLVYVSRRLPQDFDEMESFVQNLPDGHSFKAFWMQLSLATVQSDFEALLRDPKFPLDASRKQFVEDYVQTEVQPLLLHRTVPRGRALDALGVSPGILEGLLRGRPLEEMKEQDFVKEIVVEAIRMEEFAKSADPAHPLHNFVEEAHAAGLVVDNYFLGLVSFVHSPRSGRELSWEIAFLPREDLAPFVQYIERTSSVPDRSRARDGGNHRVREETGRNIGTRKFTAPSHRILIPLHSP